MKKIRNMLLLVGFMFFLLSSVHAENRMEPSDILEDVYYKKYVDESVEYLLDLEKGMEADVSFSLSLKDGIDLRHTPEIAVDAIVSQLEQAIADEWEQEMKRADYPLIPTTISDGAYMYWYHEREQRCLNCSIQWDEEKIQIRLAIVQYEPIELTWDDLPFGLTLGMPESQVEETIESLPYQYIEMYPGSAAESACYVIFLPEHDELEYLQLGTASMRSLLSAREYLDTTPILPFENVFTRVAYHWKQQEIASDRTDLIKMISETMDEKWNLAETARKEEFSWFRTIDKMMVGDPLIETELWKNEFQHVHTYDRMLIGMNQTRGHVFFDYDGGNAAAIDILKTWIE